jgi:hypothetical protein
MMFELFDRAVKLLDKVETAGKEAMLTTADALETWAALLRKHADGKPPTVGAAGEPEISEEQLAEQEERAQGMLTVQAAGSPPVGFDPTPYIQIALLILEWIRKRRNP